MLDKPELVTLVPEEEEEELPPPSKLGKQLVINVAVVMALKLATGIAVRNLARTIRQIDVLYPESLDRIRWKVSQ